MTSPFRAFGKIRSRLLNFFPSVLAASNDSEPLFRFFIAGSAGPHSPFRNHKGTRTALPDTYIYDITLDAQERVGHKRDDSLSRSPGADFQGEERVREYP
jgi:hypothetical protein